MEWYMSWLNATVWACCLPIVMVGAAVFGVGDPSLVQSWQIGTSYPDDPKGYELIVGASQLFIKSLMALMMMGMWPVITSIMYGGKIVDFNEHQWGNIVFLGIVGNGIGIWAALKFLPMIDEYFGIEPSQGISWAIRAWCFVGTV